VGVHAREGQRAQHAFRWTNEEGIVDLGDLPGGVDHSIAEAAAHGMRSLKEVLVASGVDTEGWMLMRAVGVSGDGTRILGYGYAPDRGEDAEQVAFLATLTPEVFNKQTP
jgi:probable HAF family extracellular repeat protein